MAKRGIRNNNPGNIKISDTPWEGLATLEEMTSEQLEEDVFEVFRKPWWGIRAIARILLTYQRKHGLKTIAQMIRRWSETDQEAYIDFVCSRMTMGRNALIDLTDFNLMYPMVKAICHFENGLKDTTDPYSWEYNTGIIMAGVEP